MEHGRRWATAAGPAREGPMGWCAKGWFVGIVAFAGSGVAMAGDLKVHGWTTDDQFVVERDAGESYVEDNHPAWNSFRRVTVYDTDGQRVHSLDLRSAEGADGVDRTALEAWLQAHPLAESSAGRVGPRGAHLEARSRDGSWSGPVYEVQASMDDDDDQQIVVGLSRGGEGFWEVHRQTLVATAFGGHEYTASAWFHPSQPLVAVVVDKADRFTMRGPFEGYVTVEMVKTRPLTAVLAPARLADEAEAAAASLRGMATVTVGEAKKDREATVVYYAEGFGSEAEAIAAKVGGSVDPMTWDGAQHVVVALGGT